MYATHAGVTQRKYKVFVAVAKKLLDELSRRPIWKYFMDF